MACFYEDPDGKKLIGDEFEFKPYIPFTLDYYGSICFELNDDIRSILTDKYKMRRTDEINEINEINEMKLHFRLLPNGSLGAVYIKFIHRW